jgi:hypothetical protein
MPDLKLEMDATFAKTLRNMAVNTSEAEVIRKAVATYKFLTEEVAKNSGNVVAITDSTGNVLNTITLP